MIVVINGETREMRSGATVHDAITQAGVSDHSSGVAVARNGEVVLRSMWDDIELTAGDRVEVLHAVQGG
jgi:sulfur carrier protein